MEQITREVFWNIPAGLRVMFYISAVVASVIFAGGLWSRVSVWLRGADLNDDYVYGMGTLALARESFTKFFSADCFFAKRVFERSKSRGIILTVTIWSFLTLFIGTLIIAIDFDLGLSFLKGDIYLAYSLILDIAGGLLGLCLAFYLVRRYLIKPERIVSFMDDGIVLSLMFLIVFSGFCTEGLRLLYFRPEMMDWSPVGHLFAWFFGLLLGDDKASYLAAHRLAWLSHAGSAFTFIAYIPFSKQFHMFSAQIVTAAAKARQERLKTILHD